MFIRLLLVALLVAIATADADGEVLAYDTSASAFVARGNPVYYGTGTQSKSGTNAVTLGAGASTLGSAAGIAIGQSASATGTWCISVGYNTSCVGDAGAAIGYSASMSNSGFAFGSFASSTSINGIAFGYLSSTSLGTDGIAIGSSAAASQSRALAIGSNAIADVIDGIAIGNGASTNGKTWPIAIGRGALPLDDAHAFALAIGAASVHAQTLGVSITAIPSPAATYVIPMYKSRFASTATSGTTTLTASSAPKQWFTAAQTVSLPVVSALQLGDEWTIVNLSAAGSVTVQSSGGYTKLVLAPNTAATFTCILGSGITAASWGAVGPVPAS